MGGPGQRPGHALSHGIRRATESRAKIAGLGPSGNDRCRLPFHAVGLSVTFKPPAILHTKSAPTLPVWHATVRYNNHMEFDEDDIPAPCEQPADDQFDDDLMRNLAERSHRKPEC